MRKKLDLKSKIFKQIYITTVFSSLIMIVGTLIDGILTGRFLGDASIAALGLCTPLLLISIAVAGIFSTGGQINTAQSLGRGDVKSARSWFSLTIVLAVIFGVALCVVFLAARTPIAVLLHAGAPGTPIHTEMTEYLKGFAPAVPATILAMGAMPFVQIDGGKKRLVGAMMLMTLVNIVGDLLNVFVFHGGMFGMGLATTLSAVSSAAFLLAHFFTGRANLHLSPRDIHWRQTGNLFLTGLPSGAQRVYSATANLLLNGIVASVGGSVALAAHAAKGNYAGVFLVVGSACGAAVMQTVSMLYGEEDLAGIRKIMHLAFRTALTVTAVMTLISLVFTTPLARLYLSEDSASFGMLKTAIRLYAFVFPFSALCDTIAGYFQATKRALEANVVPLLEYLVLPVGFALLLGHGKAGINGVWACYLIAEILTIAIVWIWKSLEQKNLIRDPADLVVYPADFSAAPEDCYQKDITSLDDAMEASREVLAFCRERTGEDKRGTYLAVAVEELAKNVVEHGFGKSADKNSKAELLVMWKSGNYYLRLRDNCPHFDPQSHYQKVAAGEEGGEQFGIRLVMKLAKSVYYVSTFGMNNILLTL